MKFRDLSDATQAASHSLGSLAGWLVCDRSLNFIVFSELHEILRNSKKIYEGRTRPGKKCLIMRGNIKTYLDSRIIVSPTTYSSWDIGRDIENDNQVWGATSGPFCFEKTIFNK